MKYLIITILFTISINVTAQNAVSDTLINEISDTFTSKESGKYIFVRIYNLDGKKIYKGTIKSVSKTSMELHSRGNLISIPVTEIGKIKTKHSIGTNMGKGALIGGGSLALFGLAQGNDRPGGFVTYTATDYALMGLLYGSIIGAAVGGIAAVFIKSKLNIIDGNEMKLNDFKEKLKQ